MGAKGIILTILILIVLGSIIFFAVFYFSGDGGGGILKNKNKVNCVITVKNPLFGDAFSIQSATCEVVGSCGFLTSLPFSVADVANVKLIANGAVLDSTNVNIGDIFGRTQTVQLNGCVEKTIASGRVEVRNSQGVLTDSQTVNF